ncbi:MAG: PilZ domain-containing protein [Cellvibrionaceae bacterium]
MSEKRQFFRIQQDVIFNFKAVCTDAVSHISAEQHFDHASTLGLLSQFQQFDNDLHSTLEVIRQDNLAVADYLDMLNQKMNLLSQQMLSNEAVSANDSDSGRIDLSQGGIGFDSSTPLGIESWIAVKLVFLPAYTGLLTYAQVTRNQMQEDGSYLIGARFHQLNDEQHRLLARQVMQAQLVEKRQQKSQVHH